jgi:ERCC4-type nuclease
VIQVDDRVGSSEMAPLLRSLGCPVELTRMEFGDVAFMGWGANGMPVSVGIEMKRLDDVIACITSGRFAGHQLPGLIQSYDHVWLLVCGEWRARIRDGVLEQRKPGRGGGYYWSETCGGQRTWMWRDVESWLTSMQIMGGLRVHRVPEWQEGARWIKALSSWFAKEEHHSHLVVYGGKELYQDQALLVKPTLARRVAKELPGIGVVRSAEVARTFRTVAEMVEATPKDWMQIEGIGKGIADKIYKAIHQNGNGGTK